MKWRCAFFSSLEDLYIGERLMYLALYTWVGPGLQPGPGTGSDTTLPGTP